MLQRLLYQGDIPQISLEDGVKHIPEEWHHTKNSFDSDIQQHFTDSTCSNAHPMAFPYDVKRKKRPESEPSSRNKAQNRIDACSQAQTGNAHRSIQNPGQPPKLLQPLHEVFSAGWRRGERSFDHDTKQHSNGIASCVFFLDAAHQKTRAS
ncbi:hypothetical protein B932_0113 [Gluconobacter oxydans H24]|nr:hypothetical protein B932_0113 [Gluconobacter oxydans H24]